MLFERRQSTKPVDTNQPGRRPARRDISYSDEVITPECALSVSAVLAAFTIIAEDISSLPLILYQRKSRGKDRAWGSPYYRLMHDRPNPEHTSMVFRELMVAHLLAWGNFYGQMIWDATGQVTEIWPLRPDRMSVERVNGQRVYTYLTSAGKERKFTPDDILHIPAFGFDGLVGYSRISLARNAIGLAMSAEKYGSKFFANDARPGLVLKSPKTLSDPAFDHLQRSFNDDHKGANNSWKPYILEEGLDLATIGIPPEDAQFLQTRQFQVAEIARIFRVPPHMIGDVSGSTSWGTGIDSQEQGYVNHTLRPWTVRIEQGLDQQLLLESDRNNKFFEHLFDALVRGDLATRYEAYVKAINNGIMNPNEVRSRENMNPYDGGDEYRQPLNTAPSGTRNGSTAAALAPIYVDTVHRVIRREMNDLRGATRRYLAKGQGDQFATWAQAFYSSEHPDFIKRQFVPLLEAQRQLCGDDGAESLDAYLSAYLQQRFLALEGHNADELEILIDQWQAELPQQMTAAIMRAGGLHG